MKEPNWPSYFEETVENLRKFIQINTSNPPGNETEAADFLKHILQNEGIEGYLFESQPGRGSLVAKLPSLGKKAPFILLNHLDVVPVDKEKWEVDPFAGEIRDDYLYGRGTLDMKGLGILQLITFVILKRLNLELERDVFFVATADEERGGNLGAGWLTNLATDETLSKDAGKISKNQLSLLQNMLQAEYLFTEGGEIKNLSPNSSLAEVTVAEKIPYRFELSTTGQPGHGSTPILENANNRLVKALNRLIDWSPPFKVLPTVAEFFKVLGELKACDSESREKYANLEKSLQDPEFAAKICQDKDHHAMLRDTIALTSLRSGQVTKEGVVSINVIPAEAKAYFDCRILPGTNPEALFKEIRKVIADDKVTVKVLEKGIHNPESPFQDPMYQILSDEISKTFAGSKAAPQLCPGATDARFFRRPNKLTKRSIKCYGIIPFALNYEETLNIHGNNERVSLENIKKGLQLIFNTTRRMVCEEM